MITSIALLCGWMIGLGGLGQGSQLLPPHVTAGTQESIERGLGYLLAAQSTSEGCWRNAGQWGGYPTAMTALAGLALLSHGDTPTEGPHARSVHRAMNYVLRSANRNGLISRVNEEERPMYGHGFGMLFLAQVHGMEGDPQRQGEIGQVLQAGIGLTARSQSRRGGWMYTPDSNFDEGSVTITQVQALRACRNAGLAVPKRTIDRAMAYLEASALNDGGIAYRAGMAGESRPAITAAAVACWYNAGQYDSPYAKKALEYCIRRIPIRGPQANVFAHYFYGHLYMAQIMYLARDEQGRFVYWDRYYPQMRDNLLERQREDGSWAGDYVGPVYGTSVALIILQMPYGRLPIMQR